MRAPECIGFRRRLYPCTPLTALRTVNPDLMREVRRCAVAPFVVLYEMSCVQYLSSLHRELSG